MSLLALLGWAVVHSLWQVTFLAGVTALALSVLPDRHARLRDRIACVSLALMVVLPLATAIAGADILGPATRRSAMGLMRGAVPALLRGRAILVPAAGAIWIAGVLFCAGHIAIAWRRTRVLARRGLIPAPGSLQETMGELCRRLSVRQVVTVFRSSCASVPMVIGFRRPAILLPARSTMALESSGMRAVLAHELAHVKRRDYLVNWSQLVADALLFHHPAARWVSRRIRLEREYCCDDVAVAVSGDARRYARALAALEDARGESSNVELRISNFDPGALLDRIQRIVGAPRPTLTPARGLAAVVVTSIVAAIVLGIATVVPPSLPLDATIRMRRPGPPPAPGSLPVTRSEASPGR
jgi:beta-lactamase regulating signal transducer with metallopeptidase domain